MYLSWILFRKERGSRGRKAVKKHMDEERTDEKEYLRKLQVFLWFKGK